MSDNERLFGDLMSLPLLAGCKTVAEAELRSPMMVDMRVFGGRFEQLPHPDASFDTVVPTLVLCSVREPTRALQEIRRVLRPNGTFLFLEHVADDDPQCLAWQRRIEPFWKRMAGNCHLQRRTCLSMQEVGFTFDWLERDKMRRALPFVRAPSVGALRSPGKRWELFRVLEGLCQQVVNRVDGSQFPTPEAPLRPESPTPTGI